MLPFDSKDRQQIQRKRHIGNDVVVIVFIDGDTPFSPNSISSKFNTIFIIVRKFKQTENEKEGKDKGGDTFYSGAHTYYRIRDYGKSRSAVFWSSVGQGCLP